MSRRIDCHVLPPDYSTTRSITHWMNLPRYGTQAEREALGPVGLWTLTILEGSIAGADYCGGYPSDRTATIKNSTQALTCSGEC